MGWVGLGHKNGPMDNCDPTCDGRTRRLPVIMMCYPVFVPAVWWRNKQVIARGRRDDMPLADGNSTVAKIAADLRSGPAETLLFTLGSLIYRRHLLWVLMGTLSIFSKFVLIFLPPALARKVMRSVVSVRLFVFTVTFEPPDL